MYLELRCLLGSCHSCHYWLCTFSGFHPYAIHIYIPVFTCVDKTILEPISRDNPKSAIFTSVPSLVTKIFCGLRSRWTMLFMCIQSTPFNIWLKKSLSWKNNWLKVYWNTTDFTLYYTKVYYSYIVMFITACRSLHYMTECMEYHVTQPTPTSCYH